MVSQQATLASDWPPLRMLVTGNLAATQQDSSVSSGIRQQRHFPTGTNGIKLCQIFADVSGCQTGPGVGVSNDGVPGVGHKLRSHGW